MTSRAKWSWFIALLLSSCGLLAPQIHLVIKNATAGDIENVAVSFAGHNMAAGTMVRGSHKSYGPISASDSDSAVVSWKTDEGKIHSQHLSIGSTLLGKHSGDLIFEIDTEQSVVVSFKTRR
jgi:hypothetical protein